MSGIPRYFYIFHNKFSEQNSDMYIIIPISQILKTKDH